MSRTDDQSLRSTLKRWALILGVLQIFVGCAIGFLPPSAVAWYRGIVMAHIEYTANGVLMVVFGFLVNELRLSPAFLKIWFATLQIGTWTNGTAGVVCAFLGYSSKLMPTINEKFPAPRGLDHPLPTGLLQACGVAVMIFLTLTLIGLFRNRPGPGSVSTRSFS